MSIIPLSGGNNLSFLTPPKRGAKKVAVGQSVGSVEYIPPGKPFQSMFSL